MGVPGLAKTLMVNKLAETMSLKFSRIQFTPDLMPMDITGTDILQETAGGLREFQFVHGPVFANIVLADEINRAPPKTQAAMLEAMQEQNVTVVGKAFHLERAVPGAGHAESDRAGRDLSAARGAARPVHVPDRARLSQRRRGDPDRAHDDGRCAAEARALDDRCRHHPPPEPGAAGAGAGPHLHLRGAAGAEDASGRVDCACVAQAAGFLGGGAACGPVPDPGGQGSGGAHGKLHGAARGHPGIGRAGADAPDHHDLCRTG